MNRFQIRAWDENFGKMLFAEEFPLSYEKDNGLHSGGFTDNGDWYDRPLMQSTGLYDCDGTMVYEGDILNWNGLVFPITVDSVHGHRFMFGKDQLCRAFAVNGKVVGNIFETPELLY